MEIMTFVWLPPERDRSKMSPDERQADYEASQWAKWQIVKWLAVILVVLILIGVIYNLCTR